MICERCSQEVSDTAKICPACGSVISIARNSGPSTTYGQFPNPDFEGTFSYPQNDAQATPSGGSFQYQQQFTYTSSYHTGYAPNYPPAMPTPSMPGSSKNGETLVTEVFLSLIGVFGVGWLMAGETAIGIALLVCSFIIYWPIMILGTVLTFGFGLICLGPLAIGVIILNALLLNQTLNRRTARYHAPHIR